LPWCSFTHLYTLVVRQDNTFEVFIDQVSVRSVRATRVPGCSVLA
jgi:hypothetical protein